MTKERTHLDIRKKVIKKDHRQSALLCKDVRNP